MTFILFIYTFIGIFLISNFCRVLYVVCFLLGNFPVSELRRRKHTTYRTRQKFEIKNTYTGVSVAPLMWVGSL